MRRISKIIKIFSILNLIIIIFLFTTPVTVKSQGVGQFNCVWNDNIDLCEAIGMCQAGTDMTFPDGTKCINRGGTIVDNKADCEDGNPHACLGSCSPVGFFCDPNDRLNIYECRSDGTVVVSQACATGICVDENGSVSCKTASVPPPGNVPVKTPLEGDCGGEALDTAIGCIPISNDQAVLEFFLSWAIGIAGGIAFILIFYAGIIIITSAGNPQRLQAGRELLTAAIAGIAFLVLSVIILRFIGVTVLGIPWG